MQEQEQYAGEMPSAIIPEEVPSARALAVNTREAHIKQGIAWQPIIAKAIDSASRAGETVVYFQQITSDARYPFVKNWNVYFTKKYKDGYVTVEDLKLSDQSVLETLCGITTFDELEFEAKDIALEPFREFCKITMDGCLSWNETYREVLKEEKELEDGKGFSHTADPYDNPYGV